MRTPVASEAEGGATHPEDAKATGSTLKLGWQMLALGGHIEPKLPTPLTTDYKQNDSPAQWDRHSPALGTIVHSSEWGKFEPAITRWAKIMDREAPAPTKPDGKKGQHRLNPEFTEWLMGLPEGHITRCDITRNDMLKACGNGVVPQQAALALSILLEGVEIV